MIKVYDLRINGLEDPVGVDGTVKLSWKIQSDRRNVRQRSYEIQMAADDRFEILLYDSGPVASDRSVYVGVNGIPLRSTSRYHIRVRVTTSENEQSKWEKGCFVTAFLHHGEWKGRFITPEKESDRDESRGYYLRKTVNIEKRVKEAYAFTTALGLYHFYINGEKIGEDEFTPGWTSYNRHLLYQCYDVTGRIRQGENVIGALLGAGWYKGDMGSARTRNHYGDRNAFSCQIVLRFEDDSTETYLSDPSWEWRESPVIFSEIYDGEIYDARMECRGWNEPGGSDGHWQDVDIINFRVSALAAQSGCKVKMNERIPAKRIFRTAKGETVVDFGQNLAGWVEFRVKGAPGERAAIRCFETLDKEGNAYFDNLRTAKAAVTYICGGKEAVYHPNFTYQGFRYALITDWPGEPETDDFTACAVYSDMRRTGYFVCSNSDINQLHHNILWGMKSNFLDIPTDCPQRDERLGWTGDAQIFSRTASYLMETDLFYRKWLRDVAVEQTEEGGVPHVVPDVWTGKNVEGKIFERGTHSAAGWADAAVIIPWTLYQMYGDEDVIEEQYESMKAWIDFMTAHAKDYVWKFKMQFGDWVALDAEEGSYYGATPLELTNMAYYAFSAGLFAKMAGILGRNDDEEKYGKLHEEIRHAYQKRYVAEDGHLKVQTQTAQILSLHFHLIPEEHRSTVTGDLLHLLDKEDGHLVTGFMGTPYFLQVLSDNGHAKEAYDLLLKDDFPSWLYQVKQGATTVWEHWDGIRPDGSMWSPAMNSFNHYAYGAVGEWLYRSLAGIDCEEQGAGFHKILLAPRVSDRLCFAEAAYESVYGRIVSRWEREGNDIRYHFEIPCGAGAVIRLYRAGDVEETDGLVFCEEEIGGETARTALAGSGNYTVRYRI